MSYANIASKIYNNIDKKQIDLDYPIKILFKNIKYDCKQVDSTSDRYKKLITSNNEEVILISEGYEKGWSTKMNDLSDDIRMQMIYDSRLIRFIKDSECLPEYRKLLLQKNKIMFENNYDMLFKHFMIKYFNIPICDIPENEAFSTINIYIIPVGKKFMINKAYGYEVVHF